MGGATPEHCHLGLAKLYRRTDQRKAFAAATSMQRSCQEVCKRTQAAAFSSTVGLLGLTRTPSTYSTPSATSGRSSGALSFRKVCSAISKVFQMTAVAFATFLNRFAAVVRSRTAANGDSIGFVVRRCFQWSFGN